MFQPATQHVTIPPPQPSAEPAVIDTRSDDRPQTYSAVSHKCRFHIIIYCTWLKFQKIKIIVLLTIIFLRSQKNKKILQKDRRCDRLLKTFLVFFPNLVGIFIFRWKTLWQISQKIWKGEIQGDFQISIKFSMTFITSCSMPCAAIGGLFLLVNDT